METIYSEKDQRALEEVFETLRNYEESLLYRLKRDGLNWAATGREIKRAFQEDRYRNLLVASICDMQNAMIPVLRIAQTAH